MAGPGIGAGYGAGATGGLFGRTANTIQNDPPRTTATRPDATQPATQDTTKTPPDANSRQDGVVRRVIDEGKLEALMREMGYDPADRRQRERFIEEHLLSNRKLLERVSTPATKVPEASNPKATDGKGGTAVASAQDKTQDDAAKKQTPVVEELLPVESERWRPSAAEVAEFRNTERLRRRQQELLFLAQQEVAKKERERDSQTVGWNDARSNVKDRRPHELALGRDEAARAVLASDRTAEARRAEAQASAEAARGREQRPAPVGRSWTGAEPRRDHPPATPATHPHAVQQNPSSVRTPGAPSNNSRLVGDPLPAAPSDPAFNLQGSVKLPEPHEAAKRSRHYTLVEPPPFSSSWGDKTPEPERTTVNSYASGAPVEGSKAASDHRGQDGDPSQHPEQDSWRATSPRDDRQPLFNAPTTRADVKRRWALYKKHQNELDRRDARPALSRKGAEHPSHTARNEGPKERNNPAPKDAPVMAQRELGGPAVARNGSPQASNPTQLGAQAVPPQVAVTHVHFGCNLNKAYGSRSSTAGGALSGGAALTTSRRRSKHMDQNADLMAVYRSDAPDGFARVA